jgi:hypothetical protein
LVGAPAIDPFDDGLKVGLAREKEARAQPTVRPQKKGSVLLSSSNSPLAALLTTAERGTGRRMGRHTPTDGRAIGATACRCRLAILLRFCAAGVLSLLSRRGGKERKRTSAARD